MGEPKIVASNYGFQCLRCETIVQDTEVKLFCEACSKVLLVSAKVPGNGSSGGKK